MNPVFEKKLRSYYTSLSKTEQKLADFLFAHSLDLPTLPIQEISRQAHVSTATLSRFAKKLGYTNFQEFKFDLYQKELHKKTDLFPELAPEDSAYTVMEKTFHANIHALEATKALLNKNDLNKAIKLLLSADQCGLFGLGGSSLLAATAYHKFLRTSLTCFYHEDFHIQQILASKLKKNDCAIIISHTGQNKDMLRLAEILTEQKVPIIAITSHIGSQLAQIAQITLPSISEEVLYQPEALSSIVSQISLIDTLFLSYCLKNEQQSQETLQTIRKVIQETRI